MTFLVQNLVQNRFKMLFMYKNLLHIFCTHFFLKQTFSLNTNFNTTDLTCVKALTKQVTPEMFLLRLYDREAN